MREMVKNVCKHRTKSPFRDRKLYQGKNEKTKNKKRKFYNTIMSAIKMRNKIISLKATSGYEKQKRAIEIQKV